MTFCKAKSFASNVFTFEAMKECLPKPVLAAFSAQLSQGRPLDKEISDAIAHAVRKWAMDKGATHFTHWFQPLTDSTAEKHDSFLSFAYEGTRTIPILAFSGSQLVQAEPDASSFPNGGMRNTFEARGYTVWDTTSPMFLIKDTLYIPSIFISYTGQSLDEKTPLLRSCSIISTNAVKLLRLLGDSTTESVKVTLGTEQEFFLIDRTLYESRPDLKQTGRTLYGNCPPKGQQMEDHYFGQIPERVLNLIREAELELASLGVPIKTRHNEVAPGQFELAPIFEEVQIAVDHNLLTMRVLNSVAQKHGFQALFHEKPFKGVNGSGKHCNWSLSTDSFKNLLEPGNEPQENLQFLCFLVATLVGLFNYADLLRASISSASNEHRLGAHEAPPAIISAFLGDQLNGVLNAIESQSSYTNGSNSIDIGLLCLPSIAKDLTDRNRTSPFAFTGNKFEFRAVGSRQSPSFPVTILNCAVAASIERITNEISKLPSIDPVSVLTVLRTFIAESKAIRFEGNGYSEAWIKEASLRGLPNIRSAPEAFSSLLKVSNVKMLTETCRIMTSAELNSRYHVMQETWEKSILIEARQMVQIYRLKIFPAVLAFKQRLLAYVKDLDSGEEQKVFSKLSTLSLQAYEANEKLEGQLANASAIDFVAVQQSMEELRTAVDAMEVYVPQWPLASYYQLFD